MPKATPAAVLEAYRAAFRKTLADPEYKEKRGPVIGEYDEATGSACDRAYAAATTMSAETREWCRSWLQRRFNHSF
jgi:tripartite-type tricarboxylate transporter receptor subunit TctC